MYYLEDKQHYPTPPELAKTMFDMLNKSSYKKVLEPSAGKGDLISSFLQWYGNQTFQGIKINEEKRPQIDAIEIDENLIAMLLGKKYKVVGHDFLGFNTYEQYDLIIMNPPFRNGAEHLLKAISLMQDGGEIVCILNAETIKNAYSMQRQKLIERLEEFETKVKYISNAFSDAERKTDVEIAVVHITIPVKKRRSTIFENLKKDYTKQQEREATQIRAVKSDIETLIDYYNLEVTSTLKLIEEYYSLQEIKLIDNNIGDFLTLGTTGSRYCNEEEIKNQVIKQTRIKYWKHLFSSDEISKILTNGKSTELYQQMNDFGDYEFSKFNILQLQADLYKQLVESVDDSIMKVFDYLSQQYSLEKSGNVHYFNGWKTNKSWKIGKKAIIPLYSLETWGGKVTIDWKAIEKLTDVFKAIAYLDGKTIERKDIEKVCKIVEEKQQIKNIEFPYAKLDFYKKGTVHIKFTDQEILKKLNRYGAAGRTWLPPSYGKKTYDQMTEEEKQVVDEFEGEKEYTKDLIAGNIKLQEQITKLAIGGNNAN